MKTLSARFSIPDKMAPTSGYSQIVEVTGSTTVFVAGQVAEQPDGKIVGIGDLRAQTRRVFENIGLALSSVGVDFSQLVKLTVYMVNIADIDVFRQVRDEYVDTAKPPASTAVEVSRLVHPECLIEIDAVAVR